MLSAAISCSSWDWHSPGTPESSLPLWLLSWGFCPKERPVFLSWVWLPNSKRNSQGTYKSFKFHYQSTASSGVLFGAESQLNIFLKVSGSPCQLCLCLVRIALCSLLHVTIPCFSQIRLNHYVSYQSQPWLFEMPIYDRLWNCSKLQGRYFCVPVPLCIFVKIRDLYCKSLPISMATKHSPPRLCVQVPLFSILFQLRFHNSLIFLL